ncbi:MAG: hypothetical protein K9L30_07790 [Desulfobacterales bacterium]|nr:hypothetical protein [Desulfobacterales bacterium]
MNHFLSQLDARFNSKIMLVQLAVDNCWEKAWKFNSCEKPDKSELDAYLSSGFKEIACEIFFNDPDGKQLFLGLCYEPEDNDVPECKRWVNKLFDALNFQNSGILNTINTLSKALGDKYLFQLNPSRIEVGVTDFWGSCGAQLLWQGNRPRRLSKPTVQELLSANNNLYATPLNYQSVEFSFEGKYPHWIGIQVGEKKDKIYTINIDRLMDLADNILYEL